MRMHGFGLAARLPSGWDGRLYRRSADTGESTYPILHAGTFPLPQERGDYGSGAVDVMTTNDVFVVLREFGPESAGEGLFAAQGVPELKPREFHPNALQRVRPGQSGAQRFFTTSGRPFCLYVVLGSHARRVPLTRTANALIADLEIA